MTNIDMNKFKHYVAVDDATKSSAVSYEEFYKTAEEANEAAEERWEGLTEHDKRGNRRVYVGYVTLDEMNLDWLDDDDEFDYDSPPWNGESDYDPNGIILFDSRFYQQKKDAIEHLRQFDINDDMRNYYHVFEEPTLEGDCYIARAICENDNPEPDYSDIAYMKQYLLRWNKAAFENYDYCRSLEIIPLNETIRLDELLDI